METEVFKPGDVVRLKCGGPTMVIAPPAGVVGSQDSVYCLWHSSEGVLQGQAFSPVVLRRSTPSS